MSAADALEKIFVRDGVVIKIEKWVKLGTMPIKAFAIERVGEDFKFLAGSTEDSGNKVYTLDAVTGMLHQNDGARYRRLFSLEKATKESIRGSEAAFNFEVVQHVDA